MHTPCMTVSGTQTQEDPGEVPIICFNTYPLYGFDVNYVPPISKYSITCISLMWDSHQNNAHSEVVGETL